MIDFVRDDDYGCYRLTVDGKQIGDVFDFDGVKALRIALAEASADKGAVPEIEAAHELLSKFCVGEVKDGVRPSLTDRINELYQWYYAATQPEAAAMPGKVAEGQEAARLIELWLKDDDVHRLLTAEYSRDAARKIMAWPELLRLSAPPHPVQGEPTLMAYAATDLDGRVGVGLTIADAQSRAGHGCNTIIPLYDIATPGNETAFDATPAVQGQSWSALSREAFVSDLMYGVYKAEIAALTSPAVPPSDAPVSVLVDDALAKISDIGPIAAMKWLDAMWMERMRAPIPTPTQASADVLEERRRQIEQEGWTPNRDDRYVDRELALAAASYTLEKPEWDQEVRDMPGPYWPWPNEWWKPTTPRRNLVKAGALIIAEIERLDRIAAITKQGGE